MKSVQEIGIKLTRFSVSLSFSSLDPFFHAPYHMIWFQNMTF